VPLRKRSDERNEFNSLDCLPMLSDKVAAAFHLGTKDAFDTFGDVGMSFRRRPRAFAVAVVYCI
jgi:hypothetical protein